MSEEPQNTGVAVVDVYSRLVLCIKELERDAGVDGVLPHILSSLEASASLVRAAALASRFTGQSEDKLFLGVAQNLPFSRLTLGAISVSDIKPDEALSYLRWIHAVSGRLLESHPCKYSTVPLSELEYLLRAGGYLAKFTAELCKKPGIIKLIQRQTKIDLTQLASSAPPEGQQAPGPCPQQSSDPSD